MWKLGSFFGAEGKSTPMNSYIPFMHQNSYLSVMHEIHVLLVDHDSDDSRNTKKLLEMCEYRVTLAELASDAISMLSNGKVKFHIIMANINSLDQHGIFSNLLPMAANMDIPIILMSVDDNTPMAMHAIEKGAFLLIKKPATTEMLSCLWQHVKKGKMHSTERERLIAANYSVHGIEFREVVHHSDENLGGNNMLVMKDKGKRKRTYDPVDNMMSQGRIKRKVCTEWTQELHQKFMDAVEQLGEGRCFPKEILEIMNVPGLTRMQVASHLQKCRNDNWRSPEERKSSLAAHSLSSDGDGSQYKPRRFGSMPRLVKGPSYYVQVNHTSGGGQGSKTQSESKIANDGGVENMGTRPIIASSTTTTTIHHDQLYRALNPHPSNAAPGINSSQPRHSSAEDFFVQDMDYMTPAPQGSLVMNYPHSSSGGYNIDLVYGRDENAEAPSMENDRIQWTSSDTLNFGSDDIETTGN